MFLHLYSSNPGALLYSTSCLNVIYASKRTDTVLGFQTGQHNLPCCTCFFGSSIKGLEDTPFWLKSLLLAILSLRFNENYSCKYIKLEIKTIWGINFWFVQGAFMKKNDFEKIHLTLQTSSDWLLKIGSTTPFILILFWLLAKTLC